MWTCSYPDDLIEAANARAESDLSQGIIQLLSPYSITKDESCFTAKYHFYFKSDSDRFGPYLTAYNSKVLEFLSKRFGEKFLIEIDSLWERNHSKAK